MINTITFEDLLKIDIRVGTIIDAKLFPEARNPAYQLFVDFGDDIGIKKTSAQITDNYQIDSLVGKQILGVINFPPKQIGPFMSEFLTLGLSDGNGGIILVHPEKQVPNGGRLH
jgi:tRNA-binding protein